MSSAHTTPVQHLETTLRDAPDGAIVAYLTAGLPSLAAFSDVLRRVADVADAVEVGVPFSDPMADGPTIQRASRRALDGGVTLPWILDTLEAMDPRPAAPILLMSYLNPLLAFGLDRLALRAREAGVSAFIVPDLPLEESGPLRAALEAEGLGMVQMIAPTTPAARRKKLREASRGFTYAVTVNGVTGGEAGLPHGLLDGLAEARSEGSVPLLAGFGIRRRAHVEALAGAVDGVIVGSVLLEVLERGGDPAATLQELR
jgi:tryptophan synthase alpha chain